MGSDRAERGPQGLTADRADVVVHADARQTPEVVGGTVEIRAPVAPGSRQALRLKCRVVARSEGFQAGDHLSAAVLAGKIPRKRLCLAHALTLAAAVGSQRPQFGSSAHHQRQKRALSVASGE